MRDRARRRAAVSGPPSCFFLCGPGRATRTGVWAGVWAGTSGGGTLSRKVRRGAEFVPVTTRVGTVPGNKAAPPTYSGVKARTLMGSVIKKRRKRMAKKKHRKLLRKTRHQRRNKK
jgi:Mitochondrial domain of unknown function (DUF1713)